MKIKEQDIQKAILDYLHLKGYFAWKNNTTGIYVKARDTYIPSRNAGAPDIFVIKKVCPCDQNCQSVGQLWGIEVKSSKGVQTDNQKEWQEKLEKSGSRYLLARSLDDVMKFL